MHRILYAGGELVTGDAIAEALIGYAAALARHRTSSPVEIPVVAEDGSRRQAQVLLGPASQLVTERLDGDSDLVDEPTLTRLRGDLARLDARPVIEPVAGQVDAADVTGEYDWPDP